MNNIVDITARLQSAERKQRAITAAMRLALGALNDGNLLAARKIELARGFLTPHVTPDETGEA
jgi:hypothetical protein